VSPTFFDDVDVDVDDVDDVDVDVEVLMRCRRRRRRVSTNFCVARVNTRARHKKLKSRRVDRQSRRQTLCRLTWRRKFEARGEGVDAELKDEVQRACCTRT
jgi:transposase